VSYYQSAEDIYNQMKVNVTNVDTSENSYIYNSLMPSAMENAYCLLSLDDMENKVFASKSVTSGYSEYLDLRVSEVGITRKTATYAIVPVIFTGKVGTVISKGSIVSTNDNRLYTTTTDVIIGTNGTIECNVIANASGSNYNANANDISYLPVKYTGITSVTNVNSYTSAYDKESDATLYARYLVQVQNGGVRGNKTDYETLALSVTGVGTASCIPTWNGGGTVKVVISNSNKRACDQTLIDSVYTYITNNVNMGLTLTVASIEEVALNISFTLIYNSTNYTLATVEASIKTAITDYLSSLDLSVTSIKYNKILSTIMDVKTVIDINNLAINGNTSNIPLTNTQIAILGNMTIS